MDVFAALSDPTRRAIVEFLAQGEKSAGAITGAFDLTAPAISQHLKALKSAELVTVRVDGQRRIYSLNPVGLEALDGWHELVDAARPPEAHLTPPDVMAYPPSIGWTNRRQRTTKFFPR